MPIDPNKLIELLIKYKTQATYAFAILGCVAFFIGGRYSVDIPPKSEICKAELQTIDKQFAQISQKDAVCVQKLREQRDTDDETCLSRIRSAVEKAQETTNIVQCEEVCTLYPQCKRAGRCR